MCVCVSMKAWCSLCTVLGKCSHDAIHTKSRPTTHSNAAKRAAGQTQGRLPQPQPTYTRNCSIWVACTLWFECVCVCVFAWIHTNYTSITHQKVLYTLYRWVCLPTALLYVVLYRRCSAVQLRCNIEHTLHVHIHMCVCASAGFIAFTILDTRHEYIALYMCPVCLLWLNAA